MWIKPIISGGKTKCCQGQLKNKHELTEKQHTIAQPHIQYDLYNNDDDDDDISA